MYGYRFFYDRGMNGRVMVFNNISVISWLSVLLVEGKMEWPEKTTDLSQISDKLYHITFY
jgi:hypothetical protein